MEEIKCPSCGSGAVRKITEEKYECMACDNLFLVHNLSKEFLKTDEHIENIHQDLKKTIENINLTAAVAGGSGRDGLDNRYKNAMTLLNQGNISAAKAEFTGIRNDFMWSCKGYYGLVLCEKKKKHINWGEIGDYIQQIYRCEDVTPEILQEMEGILNGGRQIALASLGKSLNERNAQQNEISSKIQQVTEVSKM